MNDGCCDHGRQGFLVDSLACGASARSSWYNNCLSVHRFASPVITGLHVDDVNSVVAEVTAARAFRTVYASTMGKIGSPGP